MTNNSDSSAGYTLVEMLVVLAILATVSGLIVAAISSASRLNGLVNRLEYASTAMAVRRLVRQVLAEARPIRLDPAKPNLLFEGHTTSLRLVSSFSPRGQFGGLHQYRIAVERDPAHETSLALVIYQSIHRSQTTKNRSQHIRKTVLLRGIAGVEFAYFAVDGGWRSAWSIRTRLPRSIRITVSFPETVEQIWLPLVANLELAEATAR